MRARRTPCISTEYYTGAFDPGVAVLSRMKLKRFFRLICLHIHVEMDALLRVGGGGKSLTHCARIKK